MRLLLVLADALAVTTAVVAVELLSGGGGSGSELGAFILMLPLWVIGAKLSGLYDSDEERVVHWTADDVVRICGVATGGVFLITEVLAAMSVGWPTAVAHAPDVAPAHAVLFWGLVIGFVICFRVAARALAVRMPINRRPTIIVGDRVTTKALARRIALHKEYRLEPLLFSPRAAGEATTRDGGNALEQYAANDLLDGAVGSLERLVEQGKVIRAIVALPLYATADVVSVVRKLRSLGVHVDLVPSRELAAVLGRKSRVDSVGGVPVLSLRPTTTSVVSRTIKRGMDVVGSLLLLLLTSPLFAVIAILIKTTSRGPVLFRQVRVGKDMRPFTFLKFRTMQEGTDETVHQAFIAATMRGEVPPAENGLFKLARRDDVTRVGGWLRRTSLDELPQLVNVLRGEMSLVGPRPCLPYEVKEFEPHHFERFRVRPGMTGLWQTTDRARATFAEALELDVLYAENWSLGFDIHLLARTPAQLTAGDVTQ